MLRLIVSLVAVFAAWSLATEAVANAAPDDGPSDGPRVRAVIVGNVGYDTVNTGWKPLNGAWNDAMFVATTLLREGVEREDITILTDRPTEATGARERQIFATDLTPDGIGTRDNILGALKKMVDTVRKGDEVLISFSGHGYHQKEMVPGNEPDGADEIFIPLDIGPPVDDGQRLERAIIDDEIGAVIDAIRAKGAHVTYIADFCHSGDTMRNAGDPGPLPTASEIGLERVERKFAPIGDGDFVKDLAVEASKGGAGWGKFVAMMAAPSDREAKQRLAPKFLAFRERYPLGVLTAYSLSNLSNPRVVSYRDLASRVASNISEFHPAAPRPLYDGDLDRPVLGGLLQTADGSASESWLVNKPEFPKGTEQLKLDSLMMSAGALQGVTEGSIVELSVARGDKEVPVLYGQVESASAYTAKLVPASFGEIPAERWDNVLDTDGKRFFDAAKLVATIVQRPVDVSFRVARPQISASPSTVQQSALDALGQVDPAKIGATFVGAEDEPDLVLSFDGDRLAVAQPGEKVTDYGTIDLAASIERGDNLVTTFQQTLTRASRFHRVRRLLASQDGIGTPQDNPAQKMTVEFFLLRSPDFVGDNGECQADQATVSKYKIAQGSVPPAATPLGSDGVTTKGVRMFEKCDLLSVKITNASDEEVYVNPLYFTSEGAIELKRSLARDMSASSAVITRYAKGESGVFHVLFGTQLALQDLQDELIILVSQAGDNADGGAASAGDGVAVSYARLQQRKVLSGAATGPIGDGKRGNGGTTLDATLDSVLGDTRRSATSGTAGATGAVRFNLTVPGAGPGSGQN